jgi:hypothetical protein
MSLMACWPRIRVKNQSRFLSFLCKIRIFSVFCEISTCKSKIFLRKNTFPVWRLRFSAFFRLFPPFSTSRQQKLNQISGFPGLITFGSRAALLSISEPLRASRSRRRDGRRRRPVPLSPNPSRFPYLTLLTDLLHMTPTLSLRIIADPSIFRLLLVFNILAPPPTPLPLSPSSSSFLFSLPFSFFPRLFPLLFSPSPPPLSLSLPIT